MLLNNKKDTLVKGSLAVLPTDTIYGIHALAFNKRVVKKVYEIRKRTKDKPFIILISSIDDLSKFGIKVDKKIRNFLNDKWPARLSVILPLPDNKFGYLHRGTQSLAFRIPDKKELVALIKDVGPLISTSVNTEGKQPAKTTEKAKEYFGDKIDIYIDEGKLESPPSTLIKVEEGKIKILREGAVKISKTKL